MMRSSNHGASETRAWRDQPANPRSQPFDREWLLRAGLLLSLYAVFLWPIIRADYAYIDDKGRSLWLYLGWTSDGRPLADIVGMAIGWAPHAFDVAPLYQLLAVATMAMAGAWTSQAVGLGRRDAVLCFGFLVCNPFFLENLSYRYDSFPMALAVAAALLPFAVHAGLGGIRQAVLLCGTTIIALALYQPAINCCLILVAYLTSARIRRDGIVQPLTDFCRSILALAAGVLAYSLLTNSLARGSYASQRQTLTGDLHAIAANIEAFVAVVAGILRGSPQGSTLGVALLLGAVALLTGSVRGDTPPRYAGAFPRLLLSALLLLGMLLGVAGPMLFLAHPVFDSRVMMGFGMLAACLASSLACLATGMKAGRLCQGFLAVLLAGQVVLAFIYGNALASQGRFEAALARQVVEDVFAEARRDDRLLAVKGTSPIAPQARSALDRLPGLRSLVRSPLDGEWSWGRVLLYGHGLPRSVEVAHHDTGPLHRRDVAAALDGVCRGRIAARRLHYDLVEVDGILILDFERICP